MMNAVGPFVLGDWTVDPATGTLTGAAGQRRLTPKLMDLLMALARRAGHVASRDELLREVWGERSAVSDEPLTRAIAELRKMLGDARADPSYIATIPKRGYRMVSPVGPAPAPSARTPAPLLLASAAMPPTAIGEPAAMLTTSVTVVPSGDLDTELPGGSPPRSREGWLQRTWRLVALGLAASGLAALVVALVPHTPTAAAPPAARPAAVFRRWHSRGDHRSFGRHPGPSHRVTRGGRCVSRRELAAARGRRPYRSRRAGGRKRPLR
jgi:DNA-binding winged helix-turn-helix (wHTH) protein